ncbi:hypothetical protein BJ875DRAFT_114149 [Amylocarpus encephaloides]|uniref:Uncharacterized protein n=1 Tax=Amylocarpus encephaloides TaxID=45428 RepID=A0A9P8CA74_9HELO|nr:hypothetical protein BJ875DRAFT_114149 [Amylocarpus encephaloides]
MRGDVNDCGLLVRYVGRGCFFLTASMAFASSWRWLLLFGMMEKTSSLVRVVLAPFFFFLLQANATVDVSFSGCW